MWPAPGPPATWRPRPAAAMPHDPTRAIHTEYVRTAITVEPREGKLCDFLPRVPTAEAYLDMVAAVEETAADLGLQELLPWNWTGTSVAAKPPDRSFRRMVTWGIRHVVNQRLEGPSDTAYGQSGAVGSGFWPVAR